MNFILETLNMNFILETLNMNFILELFIKFHQHGCRDVGNV